MIFIYITLCKSYVILKILVYTIYFCCLDIMRTIFPLFVKQLNFPLLFMPLYVQENCSMSNLGSCHQRTANLMSSDECVPTHTRTYLTQQHVRV